MMWQVLAVWSATLTDFLFHLPSPDQIRTRTPHRVCSFTVLRDIRRSIRKIVAVRLVTKLQINQSGDQTLELPGVRPDQPRVQEPADNPRSRDQLAGRDQGQMAETHAATLQPPISNVATKREELSAPQQGEASTALKQQEVSPVTKRREVSAVPRKQEKRKSRSTCGSSCYDLPLISSLG